MTPCEKPIKPKACGSRYLMVCKGVLSLLLALALLTSALPAASADAIYKPLGYWAYNGSSKGYIMSWDNATGATISNQQFMRVAFSVDRPSYRTGDSIMAMLRSDGYWMADSGWWYAVNDADFNLTFYYPNGTPLIEFTNFQTDTYGMWENKSVFTITKNMPMGRYRANGSITGPSSGGRGPNTDLSGVSIGESNNEAYLTIFFDVAGDLDISLSNVGFRVNKDTAISLNGTVLQPNGQVFNSSFVDGLGSFSYDVNISVISPNGSIVRLIETTSTGSFSQSFTPDEVGTYYVVAFVHYRLGNQVIRNKFSIGRTAEKFISEGQWPETGLGFEQSLYSVAALLALAYLERRGWAL
jgi:hypothetical protein